MASIVSWRYWYTKNHTNQCSACDAYTMFSQTLAIIEDELFGNVVWCSFVRNVCCMWWKPISAYDELGTSVKRICRHSHSHHHSGTKDDRSLWQMAVSLGSGLVNSVFRLGLVTYFSCAKGSLTSEGGRFIVYRPCTWRVRETSPSSKRRCSAKRRSVHRSFGASLVQASTDRFPLRSKCCCRVG